MDAYNLPSLHAAVYAGDLELVKKLATPDALASLAQSYTVLHLAVAAQRDASAMLAWLLEQPHVSSFIGTRDSRGLTPVLMAANNGALPLLRMLCDHSTPAALAITGRDGATALHLAARNHRADCVALLLERCAALADVADREGYLPLHAACIVVAPPRGWLASMIAGPSSAERCIAALCTPAARDACSRAGHTPLILACRMGNGAAARQLLRGGAAAGVAGAFGATALHEAVAAGALDCVTALLAHDSALAAARDDDGLAPLHYTVTALLKDHGPRALAAADALLATGAPVDQPDYANATALIKTCFHLGDNADYETLARRLVAAGADVTATYDHGWCALHVVNAAAKESPQHARLLADMMRAAPAGYTFDAGRARIIDNTRFHASRGRANRIPAATRAAVLRGDPTLRAIADRITRGDARRIVVLCGAGISTSVGIPDFRSDTGLYRGANSDMFDAATFAHDPAAMYRGCQAVFGHVMHRPAPVSVAHRFMALLERKGLLLRV